MEQLTIFDVVQEVMCTGRCDGLHIREPHPVPTDQLYVKAGKVQKYCGECRKAANKWWNTNHKKRAKYHPETGEKWCYKLGELEGHWEDPNNFRYDAQWDDNKYHQCETCENLYWLAQEKANRRSDPRYGAWEKAVKKRDGSACVLCGSEDNLHAHHLDGYNWYEEGKYAVDNGVTLCIGHHNDFHSAHGKGDNTRAQWEQYKQWYIDLTSGQ